MEVSIMDHNPADIGVPPAASEDALSEAHPAAAKQVEATPESSETVTVQATTESAQTLALPTNGSSPRRIEANRRNAKKSTGPKTSVGKALSSWNSRRHGLLSKRLPTIYGQPKKKQFTRYQTTINRQLFQAMNQLERLQRLRKGDNVPAPLNLEVSGEPPTIFQQQDSRS
jgi:hypothetical protein